VPDGVDLIPSAGGETTDRYIVLASSSSPDLTAAITGSFSGLASTQSQLSWTIQATVDDNTNQSGEKEDPYSGSLKKRLNTMQHRTNGAFGRHQPQGRDATTVINTKLTGQRCSLFTNRLIEDN